MLWFGSFYMQCASVVISIYIQIKNMTQQELSIVPTIGNSRRLERNRLITPNTMPTTGVIITVTHTNAVDRILITLSFDSDEITMNRRPIPNNGTKARRLEMAPNFDRSLFIY